MELRFCDDRGPDGFSWVVDEPLARCSHALATGGRVWLVDPVDWPEAIDRASGLGRPEAVLQLLDRHRRDCAALADRLDVPLLRVPDAVPGSPFALLPLVRARRWREHALWWAERRTLVVPEAIGTNRFATGGRGAAGVHLLLRLTPPRAALAPLEPEHLLVGHGEGVHGPAASRALHEALARSRTGLPGALVRLPLAFRAGR